MTHVAGSARRDRLASAAAGLSATLLAVALGELVAAVVEPGASPFAVIGGGLIDLAPSWAKDTAIALFGTGDKVALLTGIALALAVVAAFAGVLERWRPPVGAVILGALGALAVVVAMLRPGSGPFAWLPGLVAGLVAVIALRLLIGRLRPVAGLDPDGVDRRRFLLWTAGTAATGLVLLIAANVARGATRSVEAVRTALRLPTAARPAASVPAGAELDLPGLAPVVTPNADFYRIDTALIVPRVDPAVGGSLIGNARWLGYPTRGWSERGPIKLQSRIDVPRRGQRIEAGEAVIAGMAWQQHTGIEAVEVRVDDGPWRRAELATAICADTWVQWRLPWTAERGPHTISAARSAQTARPRPRSPLPPRRTAHRAGTAST